MIFFVISVVSWEFKNVLASGPLISIIAFDISGEKTLFSFKAAFSNKGSSMYNALFSSNNDLFVFNLSIKLVSRVQL